MKKQFLLLFFIPVISLNLIAQERVFKDVSLELEKELNLEDVELFGAENLVLNQDGDIAFYDFRERKFIHLTIDNLTINKIGKRVGRGPGEYKKVKDLKIDGNNIYFADSGKESIIKYNINGDFLAEFKIRDKFIRPARMALCKGNGAYILSEQYGPDGILHYLDSEFNILKSFKIIEGIDSRLPYFNDGELTCDEQGNLYQAYWLLNSIQKYNSKGELLFDVPVYSFHPNEKIVEKDGRFTSPAKDVRRASNEIYIVKEKMMVAYSDDKYSQSQLIDVYSKENGSYKYSITINERFRYFALNNTHMVFLQRDGDGNYKLKIYTYDSSKL